MNDRKKEYRKASIANEFNKDISEIVDFMQYSTASKSKLYTKLPDKPNFLDIILNTNAYGQFLHSLLNSKHVTVQENYLVSQIADVIF